MMIPSSLKYLLPGALLAIAACSESATAVDELAGETAADDSGDSKADAPYADAYTYYEVSADLRKCASPYCGGYFVRRLNRTSTRCSDGSYQDACYTPTLDWSHTDLDGTQQQKLTDSAYKDATTEGVYAIARGWFSSQQFFVSEAWVAESDAVSDGVFVKIADNGIRCITAPCPSLTERALNTVRSANLADLDWTDAGLSDREIQGFSDELYTGGTIVSGYRYYTSGSGKGRSVSAGYHRLVQPATP